MLMMGLVGQMCVFRYPVTRRGRWDLSRQAPGCFRDPEPCTFMHLTTAWCSFKLKSSMLSVSAIFVCSSMVVEVLPEDF